MIDRLFVYGTLQPGYPHPLAAWLQGCSSDEGAAWVRGRLYRIADYPGLVQGAAPGDTVQGRLLRLHAPARTLARLDDYEGCGPAAPVPHEYRRAVQAVSGPGGSTVPAWVYLYNRQVDPGARIASGRFGGLP